MTTHQEQSIQNELLAVVNTYSSRDYYKYGSIPPEKIKTAIQYYPVDLDDTPLALIDSTVFGSAKCGLVIGLKGLYWRNDWTTKSDRSFLSWGELAEKSDDMYTTRHGVQLTSGCEFNLSGSSMNKNVLVNLLSNIIDLYKKISQPGKQSLEKENTQDTQKSIDYDRSPLRVSSDNAAFYTELVPEIIAFCIAADGEIEDSEIELAAAIIEHDELIENKQAALESLSSNIENLISGKQRGQAIFKLKLTAIGSKITNINNDIQKEKLHVILEGMLDIVNDKGSSETASVINYIKNKIDR